MDLKGKLGELLPDTYWLEEHPVHETTRGQSAVLTEALEALTGLGYSDREVKKILPLLEKENYSNTEEVLRAAFKLLLKG